MPTYASSGGTTDEIAHTFLAMDCVPIDSGHERSDDEIIRVNHIPILEMVDFFTARISQ